MEPGPYDRHDSKWIQSAKQELEKDLNMSMQEILQEIYEQHEKTVDYRFAVLNNKPTKHVPEEIQLLADCKISCFQYKLSKKSEKLQKTISRLTWVLVGLTIVIVIFMFHPVKVIEDIELSNKTAYKNSKTKIPNNIENKGAKYNHTPIYP